jgi:GNAT superfamily N-acetyltransferase
MSDELTVREAGRGDFPAIVQLARRALGWNDDDEQFLVWKHLENPFGASPMWVALDGERIVGFRAFLRWEFATPAGATWRAVRAVDTATDPDSQGRGIFTRLTMHALDALTAEGVDLVFNTPNDKSRPGYVKMGWRVVGRLPVAVMPTNPRFPLVIATARAPAGREALPTTAGDDAGAVFADRAALTELLAAVPASSRLTTRRTPDFLAWRFGPRRLGYRAVLAGSSLRDGLAVFRRRRRGRAVEAVLCDVLVPGDDPTVTRRLVRTVARVADADYVLRIDRRRVTRDPFVRLPQVGPVLACRSLGVPVVPELGTWNLTMGDVELF